MTTEFYKSCKNNSLSYVKYFKELTTHNNGNINDTMYDYSILMIKMIEDLQYNTEDISKKNMDGFMSFYQLYDIGLKYLKNPKLCPNYEDINFINTTLKLYMVVFFDDSDERVKLWKYSEDLYITKRNKVLNIIKKIAKYTIENIGYEIFSNVDLDKVINIGFEYVMKDKYSSKKLKNEFMNCQHFSGYISRENRLKYFN